MAERELRCPHQVFADFLRLNPDDDEIDSFKLCLHELKLHPLMEDNLIPFAVYQHFPDSYYADCGRFLIVYKFNAEYVDILQILPGDAY